MFTRRELNRFRQFRRALGALRDRGMVREWPPKLSVDLFGTDFTDLRGVDEEYLRSFLTALRQFTMDKKDVHFLSICNILLRGSVSVNLRRWVAHARAAWQASHESSIGISLNGKVFPLIEILDLLSYSDIVHRDPDNLAQLEAMPKQDQVLLRMRLTALVPPMLQALNIIDHMIRYIQEDRVHEVPELVEQAVSNPTA